MKRPVISAIVLGAVAILAYTSFHHVARTAASVARPSEGVASPGVASSPQQKPLTAVAQAHAVSPSPESWYELYRSAPDRFTFVSQAAKAALAGDGRAAMYVGDAVYDCLFLMHQASHGVDIAAAHQQELQQLASSPAWVAQTKTAQFERCQKLAATDAFAGLPAREGGYANPRMWWDLAAQYKDPGAVTRDAVEKISTGNLDASQAQDAIDRAVLSRDPMALFTVGYALSDGHYSSDTNHGMAITLLACEMGYDCSWDNPALQATACKYNYEHPCQSYTDYPSFLATSLGPEKYATVYAEAQELKTYLTSQPDAALAFVKIYRPSGS